MGNEGKHTGGLDAADIRRYVEGRMTAEEMYAIEKLMAEDPFLADAVQGMKICIDKFGSSKFEADVADLKNRISGKRTAGFGTLWKAAAVLLLIATGIAITYMLQEDRKESSPGLTSVHDHREEATTMQADTAVQMDAFSADSASRIQPSSTAAAPGKRRAAATAGEKKPTPPESASSADMAFEVEEKQTQDVQEAVSAGAETDTMSEAEMALQGKAAGVVVERAEPRMRKHNDVDSSHLMEVVVTGFSGSSADDESVTRNTSSRRFEPEGGWDAFHHYVARNKKLEGSQDNNMQQLSFNIDGAGRPVNIRIIRSISKEHDAEAIRLLRNGPSWKIHKGRSKRLNLVIRF